MAVLYISYDGAAEALGQSQVVAYLEHLAREREITLVSFEKPGADREAMARRLAAAGIRWRPLSYHRRPPVLSTAWDVLAGARAVRSEPAPELIHARSDVPALIALAAGRPGKLLFDTRGFWADERVDLGIFRKGGLLYRLARRCERRFYSEADAVVVLTEAAVPQVRRWLGGRDVPVEVIPTCTDVERFAGTTPRPEGSHAVWCGSVEGWYRLDLGVRMAAVLGLPLTVLTGQVERARAAAPAAEVRSVAPERVPEQLHEGDVGLCLLRPSFAKTASAPTRVAEYLAAGMPVAVSAGVGDLEEIVESERVGVVVRDENGPALARAAAELRELAADAGARDRCRALARERFDLEAGAAAYSALYETIQR